jgi:acetoin utilization protein AcuC
MSTIKFVYDASLADYELSDSHPFKPVRLELTRTLLRELGLLEDSHIEAVRPLEAGLLRHVHDGDYVNAVKAVSQGRQVDGQLRYGLGTSDNPIFPNMHRAVKQVCAATVTAMDLVAAGKVQRAVSLAGGLHHAHTAQASGFCLYNDLAVGIEYVTRTYGLRIAYVDIDAHHGDGVQGLFYERGDVLTFSIHESGRYLFPGTGNTFELGKGDGRGLSVNVPLEPFTEDDSYLTCLREVLPKALDVFKPDMILLQAGADMHRRDPLADLALTVQGMAASYQFISELADDICDGRLVATGGGGYDPFHAVPRAWAALWAALSRQDLPENLPKSWLEDWHARSPHPLPEQFSDDISQWQDITQRDTINKHNAAVVRRLLTTLEPIWQEQAKQENKTSSAVS